MTVRNTDAVGSSRISIQNSSAIGTQITSVPSTGPTGVSARYWRFQMTNTYTSNGDSYTIELSVLELRTSTGNVALTSNGATASASLFTVGYEPNNAIDGSASTFSSTSEFDALTLDMYIDLGATLGAQNILEISMRNGPLFDAQYAPTTVVIYTSTDNSTWGSAIATWTPSAWTTLGQTQTFTLP